MFRGSWRAVHWLVSRICSQKPRSGLIYIPGSISQTLTYPFDVLRRKMQVTGMRSSGLGIAYTGAFDALTGIVRTEGVRGLYRGLWPNLRESHGTVLVTCLMPIAVKVAPSIATSFFTYELVSLFFSLRSR